MTTMDYTSDNEFKIDEIDGPEVLTLASKICATFAAGNRTSKYHFL